MVGLLLLSQSHWSTGWHRKWETIHVPTLGLWFQPEPNDAFWCCPKPSLLNTFLENQYVFEETVILSA